MGIIVNDEATAAALRVWWPGNAAEQRSPSHRARMRGALEAALVHLTDAGEPLSPAVGYISEDVRQCRICGCTDEEACPGGCSWSQPEICSTCAARQQVADEQYLATLRAQQQAAQLQSDLARAQLEAIAAARALLDEQAEVAQLQREDLAGVTWRQAVACAAAAGDGSPTQVDGVHERIEADAEWFAHLLGTPPVVF